MNEENECNGGAIVWLAASWVSLIVFTCGCSMGIYLTLAFVSLIEIK
jgi:hypothetical protein